MRLTAVSLPARRLFCEASRHLGSPDNLVLGFFTHLDEIGAVTGDPYAETFVFFRMFLSVQELLPG